MTGQDGGAPMPTTAPASVGGYAIVEVVGGGGMGVVYRAKAPDGSEVALKVIREPLATDELRERFLREARIRLEHPNVVRVLDAGIDVGGMPFIAFEMLDGESVGSWLASRPPAAAIVAMAAHACAGLEAAHREGIVHRDLKPGNLFRCRDGTIKLLDFGIAHLATSDKRLTATGRVLGTPSYLAPEQARAEPGIDPRTDVWALGVLLYEALSGTSPFDRESLLETLLAVIGYEPPPLCEIAPRVPETLSRAVEGCMRKAKEHRWSGVEVLRAQLEIALEQLDERGDWKAAARAPTQLTPAVPISSIPPGEQRLVAIVLAEGVRDASAIERAIAARQGTCLSLVGARALGLFGAEGWEGGEVVRAALAALEARPSADRIAVAAGRAVHAGAAGITGAVLRAAERGCAADVRGVAVDAESARLLTDRFDLRDAADGVREVRERSLTERARQPPTPIHVAAGPMLGREPEMARVVQAARTVTDERRAMCIVIEGAAGAGKSRLLSEIEQLLERPDLGFVALTGRADPLGRSASLGMLADVLRERARRLQRGHGAEGASAREAELDAPSLRSLPSLDAASAAEQQAAVRELAREAGFDPVHTQSMAAFLGELLRVELDAAEIAFARRDLQLMSDRLRVALHDYVEGLCAQRPVALLLDDLHWADSTSIDWLDELLDRAAGAPLLVVATARPDGLERRPSLFAGADLVRLELRGLTASDVAKLAHAVAERPLPSWLLQSLVDRTGGNPLYVEQIVRALREASTLPDSAADLPLPLSVESAVQSRLDRLEPNEKELCKRAAVIGRDFVAREIEVLGTVGAEATLGTLVRKDVLAARGRHVPGVSDREYRFRNALLATVSYRMMADAVRRALHRQAARALGGAREPDPEEIATHHERGEEPERAAGAYAHAALAASTRGDSARVLRCSERALALGAPEEARFALRMARAEVLDLEGDATAQWTELSAALEHARTDTERARALIAQAWCVLQRGDPPSAVALSDNAVQAARSSGDAHTYALVQGRRVPILVYAKQLDEAERSLVLAERGGLGAAPELRPLLAIWRAQLAGAVGDLGRRRDAYALAASLYDEVGDLRRAAGAEMNLADTYNRVGAYAEAHAALLGALDKCKRVGNRRMLGYALANLGYSLAMLGRRDEALEALDEAEGAGRALEDVRLAMGASVYRLRALLGGTDAANVASHADDVAAEAESLDLFDLEAAARAIASRAHLEAGDIARALDASERALALRDRLGSLEEDEADLFIARAAALAAAGRAAESEEVLERGRTRIRHIARRIEDPTLRHQFLENLRKHVPGL